MSQQQCLVPQSRPVAAHIARTIPGKAWVLRLGKRPPTINNVSGAEVGCQGSRRPQHPVCIEPTELHKAGAVTVAAVSAGAVSVVAVTVVVVTVVAVIVAVVTAAAVTGSVVTAGATAVAVVTAGATA